MKLNTSNMFLRGSDASLTPQNASYVSFFVVKSPEKMAKEAFRRCREKPECHNQMLSEEMLYFATHRAIEIRTDLTEDQKEEEREKHQHYFKQYPVSLQFSGYTHLLKLRQTCLILKTLTFDKKCLKENILSADYNFTLIFKEYQNIEEEYKASRDKLVILPVIYDEREMFSNDNSYPFEKQKQTLNHLINEGLKVQL